MPRIDLVFRTIGERTTDFALKLALQNIAPDRVHTIENITPFSKAIKEMLAMPYDCDFVVFMDADCLIMEDMRPFLNENTLPYVDCYVFDKFMGRRHMGVHITRIDVVQAMRQVIPDADNMKYVLRPESYLRKQALKRLGGLNKQFACFKIFHDFCQYYHHIFAKYALRELRSRAVENQAGLIRSLSTWPTNDLDFVVARRAITYAREVIAAQQSVSDVNDFITDLPAIARHELASMGIQDKLPLDSSELANLEREAQQNGYFDSKEKKVFGIGLSRTGTKSLTRALNVLDYVVIHYPIDSTTFKELTTGQYDLSLLKPGNFDGITDIGGASFYAQLDRVYPDSKFILTIREKEAWLEAMERHWDKKVVFEEVAGQETKLQMRRFLRAATYGCYTFNRKRLSYVYDLHLKNVMDYFRNRPESLLILDITNGDGWAKLCSFLNEPILEAPFPHLRKRADL